MPPIVKITNKDQFHQAMNDSHSKPVVIDIYSKNDAASRSMKPVFQELSQHPQYSNYKFYTLEEDSHSGELNEFKHQLGSQGPSTYVWLKDGHPKKKTRCHNKDSLMHEMQTPL